MENESTPVVALAKAIQVSGSQSRLANLLGVTQQSVSAWVLKSKPLPAEFVLRVEAATGISRHDLRPDIYPRDLPVAGDAVQGHDPLQGLAA